MTLAIIAAIIIPHMVPGPSLPPTPPENPYVTYARQSAIRHGLPPDWLIAQITVENREWDPSAVSSHGAVGLTQIVPWAHPSVDPWNPYASIDYLAAHNEAILKKYGSWEWTWSAWNAGEPTVVKFGGVPPYAETRLYIERVKREYSARTGLRVPGGER